MARNPDSIDAEHLHQVVNSRGYQMIRERLVTMHDTRVRELCKDLDPAATAKARGFIEAIQRCLDVPNILKAELKPGNNRGSV